MTVYGPIALATPVSLFDGIVNSIDAIRSGNATGWHITKDARDPARVPIVAGTPNPTGPITLARNSGVEQLTNFEAIYPAFNQFEILDAVKDGGGVIHAFMRRVNGTTVVTDILRITSTDGGHTFSPWQTATPINFVSPPIAGVPVSMKFFKRVDPTPGGWGIIIGWADSPTGVQKRIFFGETPNLTSVSFFNTPLIVDAGGGFFNQDFGGYYFVNPSSVAYVYTIHGGSIKRMTITGDTILGGVTVGPLTHFQNLGSIPGIGFPVTSRIDAIWIDAGNVKFIVASTKGSSATESGCHTLTTPNLELTESMTLVPGGRVFTGFLDGTATASDNLNAPSAALKISNNTVEKLFCTNKRFALGKFRLIIKDLNLPGDLDGLPDLAGNNYELVVLKSDYVSPIGGEYSLVLLYPVTVPANTDAYTASKRPIFMRPVRRWAVGVPDNIKRFYFEPHALPNDAYGPSIESQPTVGDSHQLHLRVEQRVIHAYVESSLSLKKQILHYNILDTEIGMNTGNAEYNQDNIVTLAMGSDQGAQCIYLGRSGGVETSGLRGTGYSFYPLGTIESYQGVLSDNNLVDGIEYVFVPYVADNEGTFVTAPNKNLIYVAGRMKDVFLLGTTSPNLSIVSVAGVSYKLFTPSTNPGSNFAACLPSHLLVRWD